MLRNVQQLQAMCLGYSQVSIDVYMSNHYEPNITVWLFSYNTDKVRLVDSYDFCQSESKEKHNQTLSKLKTDISNLGVEV